MKNLNQLSQVLSAVPNSNGNSLVAELLTEADLTTVSGGGGYFQSGNYTQTSGDYHMSGGGNHNQMGGGSYFQLPA